MNDVHAERAQIGSFEAYGIEIEYMIVDAGTLDVLPVTDRVLHAMTGDYSDEVEVGALGWSNELALHVIELKTNGPAPPSPGSTRHSRRMSVASTACCASSVAG